MKRILATLSFFTRLPFWRIANLEKKHYENVVPLWPLAGYVTGGVMAVVFWAASYYTSASVAIILALLSRVLITGALHEDGFADFCDGFGGGTSRERILAIMKDSHIGTYGVLGLILYYLLLFNLLADIQSGCMMALMIIADTLSKMLASTIIYNLPYARTEEEAKNKLVYKRPNIKNRLTTIVVGVIPAIILVAAVPGLDAAPIIKACIASTCTALALFYYMKKRIGGYTGDCCGATFIILETVFYLTIALFLK